MNDAAEMLQNAVRLHRAGQLAEAEQIYRQILAANPRHAAALDLLGVAAQHSARHQEAVALIGQAIAIDPSQADYHFHLGVAQQALNRMGEAQASYRRALELQPAFAAAHYNLALLMQAGGELVASQSHFEQAIRLEPAWADAHSSLGRVLQDQARLADAAASYRAALRCEPNHSIALNNLGSVRIALGQFVDALEPLERLSRLSPEHPECHFNLGRAYRGLGRLAEATDQMQQAVRLRGNFLGAHCELAALYEQQGQLANCEAQYRAALGLKPDYVEVLNNLAIVLRAQGKLSEALACYDRAISLRPQFVMAHFNRAITYQDLNRTELAIAGYREALRRDPRHANSCINLSILYDTTARPDEAVEFATRALDLGADSAMTRAALANGLRSQGRTVEAIGWFRRSLELKLDAAQHSNLLYCLNFDPHYTPAQLHAKHLAWARHYAEPLTAAAAPHANDRTAERRLRVGYVSPHFREHAVNYFSEPLLSAHNHEQFEVYCYSTSRQTDDITIRLRALADQWCDVPSLSDEALARQVRQDQIDILVDLTGHIGENRLLTFARKPAPIQVTYLGYQNTTGMSAMDYRLTDQRADPPGQSEAYYTEQLIRLPRSFFCYRPSDDAPPVAPLPATSAGHVTFGSLNHIAKITPEALTAWCQILARVPNSRLFVLANRGGYAEHHLHEVARSHGIDPARVGVCDKRPRLDYLRLIQRADIALDPFSFNGHTTTCDSIWMGVPMVMLQGATYASRFGGSVLANVGLEDWIARSPEEYVECAVARAADLDGLANLRQTLRAEMAKSVLLDFAGFTRNLELAYRQMWLAWCEGSCT